MSYLVLARKYRPRNFTEMVGQDHVVQAMTNALTTQRLHHAYLFTGTRGVGKTSVSRILAKSLNCRGPDGSGSITASPCGVCQACVDIDSGRFVDYTELDAASNRGVDEVQALLEQAVYKPVLGRFKVFMIDEVHMLTNTAFNAMLKTLEEPPEYLKFVLATTDPQKVPVTVLSRCLQFNLRPMAPETIREHLEKVLRTEDVRADAQSLRLLARAARGSMRDALSLTDQAIAFGAGQLMETTVRQMLGSVDRSYVFRLLQALAEGDGKTVVETSETLRINGLSAASTLEEMSNVLQRMAVLQSVPDLAAAADETDPEAADVARLAALMPPDETQLLYSICLHGRGELGLAPDDYAALTMVLLRLLAFKPCSAVATTVKKKDLISPPVELVAGISAFQSGPSMPIVAPVALEISPVTVGVTVAATIPLAQPALHVQPVRLQPWDDEIKPAAAALPIAFVDLELIANERSVEEVLLPPGQNVPVRTMPSSLALSTRTELMSKPGLVTGSSPHSRVQAIPVRQQADSRVEALADQSAAAMLIPSDEGEFWHAIVQQLIVSEAISALVRELALQSQLVVRDTDQWLLRVERESLNQSGPRDRLTTALVAAGHGVRLVVEIGRVTDSPAKRNAEAAAERQLAAEKIIFDNPFVQILMQDFGAKIVPGSIKPV